MPLLLKHKDVDSLWGIWQMSEAYEDLCASLPSVMVAEAESRFQAPHRRQEWLSVRALLRELAGEDCEILYRPSGKPYLLDASTFISISHTRGYVAVILGRKPVGIDIEQYGPRVHKVASRFMRADEVANLYEGDDTWSLLLHWSAKETMFKCLDTMEVWISRSICGYFLSRLSTKAFSMPANTRQHPGGHSSYIIYCIPISC